MSRITLNIGSDIFRNIRENSDYYVDKTGFVEEFLASTPAAVSIVTRPRRFGKSLMLSMLSEFFDITKKNQNLFEGLAITQNQALCDAWMNRYPVILLSLKQVEGKDFKHALQKVSQVISGVCEEHSYLLSSSLSENIRRKLGLLALEQGDQATLEDALLTLCKAFHSHYGLAPIVLIDEYDVPVEKALQHGYYDEMFCFICNFFGAALKSNPSLKFAILTGCLRISKESIFTGLNNFSCYGLSEEKFSQQFGFTENEVAKLLDDAGLSEKFAVVRERYDGYRFGNGHEIFCPWDVLKYTDEQLFDPSAPPKPYWINSSSNDIVKKILERTDFNLTDKFERLMSGGSIETEIFETLAYDTIHSSEENLWSVLYMTGYLTKSREQPVGRLTRLEIPNKEILEIFNQSVKIWFTESMIASPRKELFDSFWSQDQQRFTELVGRILAKSISYHDDYHENFYQAFIAGLFVGCGYQVQSNKESG